MNAWQLIASCRITTSKQTAVTERCFFFFGIVWLGGKKKKKKKKKRKEEKIKSECIFTQARIRDHGRGSGEAHGADPAGSCQNCQHQNKVRDLLAVESKD